MARINFEESVFSDHRWSDLLLRVGDMDKAIGLLIRTWLLGQKWYRAPNKMIPLPEWNKSNISNVIIESGWATIVDDFVRVSGDQKYFGWLEKRAESGRKGGRAKALKSKNFTAEIIEEKSWQTVANPSKPWQTVASYSLSNTSTLGFKTNSVGENEFPLTESVNKLARQEKPQRGKQRSPEQNDRIKKFVAAYVSAYSTKFETGRPEDLNDPKVRGQIAQWAQDHPDIERACQLVQVFFQMDEKWFETKGYDFITFKNNLNRIGRALDSGVNPTGIDWAKIKRELGQ